MWKFIGNDRPVFGVAKSLLVYTVLGGHLLGDSAAEKSNTVAECYVENSIINKQKIGTNILGENYMDNAQINTSEKTTLSAGVNITNWSNCVINIYE